MDENSQRKRTTPAVEPFGALFSMTASAQRNQRRWVPGWLRLAAIHIAQLSVGIRFSF